MPVFPAIEGAETDTQNSRNLFLGLAHQLAQTPNQVTHLRLTLGEAGKGRSRNPL